MVGYSFLQLSKKPAKKHAAGLGIVIGDKYQNKGYGRQLMETMIKSSWQAGLKRIWINVYDDNPRAFHPYESLGFKKEGMFICDEMTAKGFRNTIAMAVVL